MTSRDFCFWLQGYFEVSEPTAMSESALKIVKQHLSMVFKHEIDPSMGNEVHQQELNQIHFTPPKKDGDIVMRC